MGLGLDQTCWEDPTFRVHTDEETGQTWYGWVATFEIILDRFETWALALTNTGAPQVAYRETFVAPLAQGKHINKSGRGQYGDVWIKFEPNEPGRASSLSIWLKVVWFLQEYRKPVQQGVEGNS